MLYTKLLVLQVILPLLFMPPIAVSSDITTFTSGIFKTPPNISDHFGTYIYINFVLNKSSSYKRKIWNYKRADFDHLNVLISTNDWSFIQNNTIHESCDLFTNKIIELAELCIPRKEVTIRPYDKPWYDSEIRRHQGNVTVKKNLQLNQKIILT